MLLGGASLGGGFGGLGGGLFDDGGIARGVGMMPKATIAPERVLSPSQTAAFERLPASLERLAATLERGGRSTTIHAPFTVTGDARGGEAARDRLLALLN